MFIILNASLRLKNISIAICCKRWLSEWAQMAPLTFVLTARVLASFWEQVCEKHGHGKASPDACSLALSHTHRQWQVRTGKQDLALPRLRERERARERKLQPNESESVLTLEKGKLRWKLTNVALGKGKCIPGNTGSSARGIHRRGGPPVRVCICFDARRCVCVYGAKANGLPHYHTHPDMCCFIWQRAPVANRVALCAASNSSSGPCFFLPLSSSSITPLYVMSPRVCVCVCGGRMGHIF